MAPTQRSQAYRPSLAVTFQGVPQGIDTPKQFLEVMSAPLRQSGVPQRELEGFDINVGGMDGWCVTRILDLEGQHIRQLNAAAFVGDMVVIATASMLESRHQEDTPLLQEMIEGIQVDD